MLPTDGDLDELQGNWVVEADDVEGDRARILRISGKLWRMGEDGGYLKLGEGKIMAGRFALSPVRELELRLSTEGGAVTFHAHKCEQVARAQRGKGQHVQGTMGTGGRPARTRPPASAFSIWRTTSPAEAAIERYFDELAHSAVKGV